MGGGVVGAGCGAVGEGEGDCAGVDFVGEGGGGEGGFEGECVAG